jgi:hypothetical protein
MLSKHEKKMYALIIGACVMSVVLGVVVGYLLFGGAMLPSNTPSTAQYRAASLYPNDTALGILTSSRDDTADAIPTEAAQSEDNPPLTDVFAETIPAHHYVLRIAGGYIAVYYAEEAGGGLKELTTVPASALPEADMEGLAEGIRVYSEEGLARILQDYGS